MADRPDLDEFLSALNGFLDKETTTPQDPSYLRFLEIFCRSVGSSEGHLLKYKEGQGLQSLVAFGLTKAFEKELNQAIQSAPKREPSPLDAAFQDQQVVAVVELKRGSGVPTWFMEVMGHHNYKALIAVPLIGQQKPVGILCAYYRDACLFDKGTLDRLMTVGRMVGAATEKSLSPGQSDSGGTEKISDEYLRLLTTQSITKEHIYTALIKILAKSLSPTGVVCGPVRMFNNELILNVVEATGIPMNAMSQRLPLPPFLAQQMLLGQANKIQEAIPSDAWGSFRPFILGKAAVALGVPVLWQKQPQAAIVAWRSERTPFTPSEQALASRLAGITALALQAV